MSDRYIEVEQLSSTTRNVIIVVFFVVAIMALSFLIAMYSNIPPSGDRLNSQYSSLKHASAMPPATRRKACRAFTAPQEILRLSTRSDPKVNTGLSLNGQIMVDMVVSETPGMPVMVHKSQTRITPLNDMFESRGPNEWRLKASYITTLGVDDTVSVENVDPANITYTIANVVDYPNLRRFAMENNAIAFRPGYMFQLEGNAWLPITAC